MKTAFQIAVSMTVSQIQDELKRIGSDLARLDAERSVLMQQRKEHQKGLADRRLRDRCSR